MTQIIPIRLAHLLADGHGCEKVGDVEGAIARYREAIDRFPRDAMARHRLAALLGRLGQLDDAIPLAAEAVALSPSLMVAREELGALLLQARQAPQARRALEEAVNVAGGEGASSAELLYELGVAYLMLDEVENADRVLRFAVERSPHDSFLRAAAAAAAALASGRRRALARGRQPTRGEFSGRSDRGARTAPIARRC